jgi:hypothetical protein
MGGSNTLSNGQDMIDLPDNLLPISVGVMTISGSSMMITQSSLDYLRGYQERNTDKQQEKDEG